MVVLIYNAVVLGLVGTALALIGRARPRERLTTTVGVAAILLVVALVSALFGFPNDRFGQMQLLAWAVFVHGPLFLAGLVVLIWSIRRGLAAALGACALVAVAIGVDAFLVEPTRLEVTRVRLPARDLERPVTVALVADIQTDDPGPFEEHALRRTMAAEPDLILLAGDYVQEEDDAEYFEAAVSLNGIMGRVGLQAPLGVFAVEGNVDPAGSWTDVFAGLPVTPIVETTELDLGPLVLTCLDLKDSYDPGLFLARGTKYHLVLGHCPDYGLGRVRADLSLAGHTHGGQVRLPLIGALISFSRVPRHWTAGVIPLDDQRTLVVSRGIGMERGNAPRLRFLCRPQVVIIDLQPV